MKGIMNIVIIVYTLIRKITVGYCNSTIICNFSFNSALMFSKFQHSLNVFRFV